jgi:prophage antirepressor-like protein
MNTSETLFPFMNFSGDFITFDVGAKKDQRIRLVGTHDDPFFCGKDVCKILEYASSKKALQDHVDEDCKRS